MKKRNGFVSNSSSSSFIAVGIKMKDVGFPESWTEEDKEKFIDNNDHGYHYIGHCISYGVEDEGFESIKLDDVIKYRAETIEYLQEKGLTFDEDNIKLLYGNVEC